MLKITDYTFLLVSFLQDFQSCLRSIVRFCVVYFLFFSLYFSIIIIYAYYSQYYYICYNLPAYDTHTIILSLTPRKKDTVFRFNVHVNVKHL